MNIFIKLLKGEMIFMKKLIYVGFLCGVMTASIPFMTYAANTDTNLTDEIEITSDSEQTADEDIVLISADVEKPIYDNSEAINLIVGEKRTALSKNDVYMDKNNTMVPLKKTAEKLGFKVEWNGANKSVKLDNGEVNTIIYIGLDSYYMASSTAVGMSAPTPLGSAPVIKNGSTYVPADMFGILLGNKVEIVEKTENKEQIPNPIKEYKSIDEAERALGFNVKIPNEIKDYKLDCITTISDDLFQLIYTNNDTEITYRMARGNEDISGDYNEYRDIIDTKVGDNNLIIKRNSRTICATWADDEYSYSLYSTENMTIDEFEEIIKSIK